MEGDPLIPDFPGAVVEHDSQPYNLYRHYADRDGTLWACLNRRDEHPLWVRRRGEAGIPIAELIDQHGPLTLVWDAFWDATDEELSEMVSQALSRTDSNT